MLYTIIAENKNKIIHFRNKNISQYSNDKKKLSLFTCNLYLTTVSINAISDKLLGKQYL